MSSGSRRYKDLQTRLEHLRGHLLHFLPAPPTSRLQYSDQELDATRAYVVLAHAEMESFCEDVALAKAQSAKTTFDSTGKVKPALRRIVVHYVVKKGKSWDEVLTPPTAIVGSAFESYKSTVRDNHGLKRKNLEKLLFPIGVLDTRLDGTWVAQMDSFGGNRGKFAHSSARVQTPLDPLTELTTVNQLLQGLLKLDRLLATIR